MSRDVKSVNEGWIAVHAGNKNLWQGSRGVFERSLARASRRVIERYAALNQESRVLEEGCGGSSLAFAVARKTRAGLYGLDISRDALKTSARNAETLSSEDHRLGIRLVQGDVFALPFAAGSFDLILSDGVIEHFGSREARIEMLKESLRCLKPGGYLLTIIPNNEHPLTALWQKTGYPWLDEKSPIREYLIGAKALSEEYVRAGLKILESDGELPWSTIAKYPNWFVLRALAHVLNKALPLPRAARLKWGLEVFVLGQKKEEVS